MTIATKIRQLAAAVLLAAAPAAQSALPYSDGDLILGFRATSGDGALSCYEVNLGQSTQFMGVANAFQVNIPSTNPGGIKNDLIALFGEDWSTRPDVYWSVSGAQFEARVAEPLTPRRTVFVSKAETTAGVQSSPWLRATLSTQGGVALKVQQMGTPGYSAGTVTGSPGQTQSENCAVALIQDNGAQDSYRSYMPGGVNASVGGAFAFYVNGSLGIENTFSDLGPSRSVIDLYQMNTALAAEVGTPGTFLGAFRLDANGILTFSPTPGDFAGEATVAFDNAFYSVGEEAGNATLTIVRAGTTTSAFTVSVTTANGTALAGTDYTALTNFAVPFASGETSKTVNIPITDVAGFQGSRNFTASIAVTSGTASATAPSTTAVTINDNDPQPVNIRFTDAAQTVSEDAGLVTVAITRSSGVGAMSVNFSTQDGTAIAGVNYTAQTNTVVNFADGESSKTVDVAITDVAGFTGDRSFNVSLSGPTNGGVLGNPSTKTITIHDTDENTSGQIRFSSNSYSFGSKNAQGQPNTVVLTLLRDNGTTGAVSVDVSFVAAGSNLDALDFSFTSPTTVNFADGQSTATVNVPLLAGASPLPGVINFAIGNPAGGVTVAQPSTTTVNITVPDSIPPRIVLDSPKAGKSPAVFNVAGTVFEADTVDRVEVTLNGALLPLAVLGTNVNGATSFHLDGVSAENGVNTLTVVAFDTKGTASLVKKVTFTYVNERPGFVGSFNGLASPTAAAPPGGDANNASGFVTVTVTKTGAFTGKVIIGGATLPIKGVFANDGAARFAPTMGETYPLVKKGKVPVQFGDLALKIATATVGTLNVSRITGTIGTTSVIECDRAAFDGKTVLVDPAVLANKGKYTCVLPSGAQAGLTGAQFPQGDGIGTITVLKTGKLKFVGSLADGTPVVASAPLSALYTAPIYASLYVKKGSIAGLLAVGPANLDPNADISGEEFRWLRPADPKAKYYSAGWPGGIFVDFTAASFNAAKQTPPVSVFPGLNATGEVTLEFADGMLGGNPTGGLLTKEATISTTNKVTNVPATDKSYKLTVVSGTGALLGNFTHTDGSKPKFKGIVYQKGTSKGGYGYFLTVVPKGGPSGHSGGVSVVPKP